MNAHRRYTESGQSLVIIALGLVAFVAMLALVLDGANAYAAKRQAQNAADAGALAGATFMCKNKDLAGGITQARDYAINRNGASSADVVASLDAGTVEVTATVHRNTFFAGVIGFSQLAPRAVAVAKCETPMGLGVLPIAWSCRANAGNLPGEDCVQKIYPDCSNNPYDKNCTYIIMDSVKVVKNCPLKDQQPDGTCANQDIECAANIPNPNAPPSCIADPSDIDQGKIACDTNGDCINELLSAGARSWLDLLPDVNGAQSVTDVMCNKEIPPAIPAHTWEPTKNGVSTSIFDKGGACVLGKDVVLPVFNELCKGVPNQFVDPENNAVCSYGPLDDLSYVKSNGLPNYHIITFSEFHVTCVQTGKGSNKVTAEPGYQWVDPQHKECNGHYWASNIPGVPSGGTIKDNDKTIEGYFKKVDLGGYGGPGNWFDAGTFTVVLTK